MKIFEQTRKFEESCRKKLPIMAEPLLTSLSIEHSHHPSTLLSMDSIGVSLDNCDCSLLISRPPDINLPLSSNNYTNLCCDILNVGLGGPQIYEAEANLLNIPKCSVAKQKCSKRGDGIWGAWFFFTFYFKPIIAEKSIAKVTHAANGSVEFDKSDLRLDDFLVQHDMENIYMWVFKERPENALGKMQLRSYMNGHSRLGEPQFPFSVDKGFVRSHRMQRKQYKGLSNPQCIHGIEIVRLPNLTFVTEVDCKKWMELTGRDLNFAIPPEASGFGSWRNLPSTDFEFERPTSTLPALKASNSHHNNAKKLLNGSVLNLSTQPINLNSSSTGSSSADAMDSLRNFSNKRKKDSTPKEAMSKCYLPKNSCVETQHKEPSWLKDFSGVMNHVYGPVTAAKTIYEDEDGYLIMVSLPFADKQGVKVSWRNNLTHGIVKISCSSIARAPCIRRHDRTFKLADPNPEHCPSGEFVREISLATRIPEDAKLEAYYDETGTILEIMVPKHHVGLEEHEVIVCRRPPHLGANELC